MELQQTQATTSKQENTNGDDEEVHKEMSFLGKAILLFFVIMPFVGLGGGIFQLWNSWVGWQELLGLLVFYLVRIWGVGIGFHRMQTHKGFEAYWPVRLFWLAAGSLSLEGKVREWVATHHKHHAMSDKEGDPHSPLDGFWHSHFLWLFRNLFVRRGRWYDLDKDDKVVNFVDKLFWLSAILTFVLPGAFSWILGGSFWHGVLWGGLIGLFFTQHVTWSINSITHTFGSQEFKTPTDDRSRNNLIFGLIGQGEGWHNNHHAFSRSAYHGLRRWQVDVNGYIIRLMEVLGLVWNVQRPTKEQMDRARRQAE